MLASAQSLGLTFAREKFDEQQRNKATKLSKRRIFCPGLAGKML
jgi:hypothetical protein